MEGKQVPWWRKALSIALSGIRSGFGLFSRTQKHIDEIEPETVAGHEEILEKEAELTEHTPEQNSIVDEVSPVEVVVAFQESPVAAVVTEPEVTMQTEPETGAEPEVEIEAPVVESAPESDVHSEIEPKPEVVIEIAEVAAQVEEVRVPDPMAEAANVIADPEPELPKQEPPAAPTYEACFEQVTEQQVTVENVIVDEVALLAEAAISEDSAPESPSPVPDEMVEPASQTAEDAIEEPAEVAAEQHMNEIAEQTRDKIEEQTSDEPVEQVTEEIATGTNEQHMELNHSNSEPAAEQELTAKNTSPLAAPAEEPANVPESPADESALVDEPAAPAAVAAVAQHPSKPFIKLEAKEGEANASAFSVIVSQVYDGPLDLLLDLIRKQDIDIYDIPIARITAQFLAYVNQLKASDVDVAGEFIYTASLLIHIKSKMLLPRAPSGPDDAADDPRRELVERLLEHERFKNAAQMLQQKQMLEAATWTNPGVRDFKEDAGTEPEIAADTVDLVRVFREILERARNRPVLNVEEDSVTVGQMIQFLSRRLSMEDKPIALRKLLSHSRSERALIAMFLALLELVRLQAILLRQDLAFSEIFIKKHSNFESVMTEGVAQDDWK